MTRQAFEAAVQRDIDALVQRATPAAPDYTTRCATCGVEVCRHFDGWDGSPLGCAETCRRWGAHAPAEAPAPVPTRRRYTFAVYVEAPEPVVDADGYEDNGYTQANIEALVKQTLTHYAAPLNKERGAVLVDWELMEHEAVEPAARR
jgi:hypothetical protein